MKEPRVTGLRSVSGAFSRKGRAPKVAELLARDIVNYIIEENLQAGAKLPSERQMLKEMGHARNTLREALRLLESRGVVEIRQGVDGGPIVKRINAKDLGEALSLILALEGGTMLDVLNAREDLEVLALDRAIGKLTKKQLIQLQQSIETQKEHINNRYIFLEESRRFHAVIFKASGSLIIALLNEALQLTTHINIEDVEYTLEHKQHVIHAHEEILAALRSKNRRKAREVMRQHVCQSGSYWQKITGPLAKRRIRWP